MAAFTSGASSDYGAGASGQLCGTPAELQAAMADLRASSSLLLLLCVLRSSHASVADPLLFEKESGLDTIFPPPIAMRAEDDIVPVGHLRPLGYQHYPEEQVEVLIKQPSASEMHERIANGTPFLFPESGQTESRIFQITDEELDREFGSEKIHYVPIPRHRSKEVVEPDTLRSFLNTYKKRDEYLATTMPESMRHLFPVPFSLQCGPYTRRLLEAELWMAWGGTGSFMHYHGDHQLHCMIDGRKDIIFVEPKYKDKFKCQETRPNSGEGISTINMDMINMFEDAAITEVPWSFAIATRGQCVFIPAGFLHHVRSHGRALSYKIHFAVLPKDDNTVDETTKCSKMVPKASRSLQDFDFVWTMKNGVEQLSNEHLTAEDLMALLKLVARGEDVLSKEQFVAFYERAMQKAKSRSDSFPTGEKVFNFLDKKRTKALRISKLALMESRLTQLAKVLNKVHLPEHTEL